MGMRVTELLSGLMLDAIDGEIIAVFQRGEGIVVNFAIEGETFRMQLDRYNTRRERQNGEENHSVAARHLRPELRPAGTSGLAIVKPPEPRLPDA